MFDVVLLPDTSNLESLYFPILLLWVKVGRYTIGMSKYLVSLFNSSTVKLGAWSHGKFCSCVVFKYLYERTCNLFNYSLYSSCGSCGIDSDVLLVTLCKQVELVCRIATVLLQTHFNQLVTTLSARPVLSVLKDILYSRVKVILQFSRMLVFRRCMNFIISNKINR